LDWYFDQFLSFAGKPQLTESKEIIFEAAKDLSLLLQNNTNNFLDVCGEDRCLNATEDILSLMSGQDDLIDCLYQGVPSAGYFRGWSDQILSKAGYLLMIANLGLTVQSAYVTLQT